MGCSWPQPRSSSDPRPSISESLEAYIHDHLNLNNLSSDLPPHSCFNLPLIQNILILVVVFIFQSRVRQFLKLAILQSLSFGLNLKRRFIPILLVLPCVLYCIFLDPTFKVPLYALILTLIFITHFALLVVAVFLFDIGTFIDKPVQAQQLLDFGPLRPMIKGIADGKILLLAERRRRPATEPCRWHRATCRDVRAERQEEGKDLPLALLPIDMQ